MCHKNAQVEGHRKALGIARNPDAHIADESCFVAVFGETKQNKTQPHTGYPDFPQSVMPSYALQLYSVSWHVSANENMGIKADYISF